MGEAEITCMCMVLDRSKNRVLVQDRIKNWNGINFPGGHLEDGESLVEAAIREVKEETGLTVSNLRACGVMHWYNEKTRERYFVFNFKTETFSGDLIDETEEGKVFWADLKDLPGLDFAKGFKERLPMFLEDKYIEGFGKWDDESTVYPMKWF